MDSGCSLSHRMGEGQGEGDRDNLFADTAENRDGRDGTGEIQSQAENKMNSKPKHFSHSL
jgi:hypothetical protein